MQQDCLITAEEIKPPIVEGSFESAVVKAFDELAGKNLLTLSLRTQKPLLIKTARKLDNDLDNSAKLSMAAVSALKIILDTLETLPTETGATADRWDTTELIVQEETQRVAAEVAKIRQDMHIGGGDEQA